MNSHLQNNTATDKKFNFENVSKVKRKSNNINKIDRIKYTCITCGDHEILRIYL